MKRREHTSPSTRCKYTLGGLILLLFALLVRSEVGWRSPQEAFKLYIDTRGVYRVSYEDLAQAGLEGTLATEKLALTHRGMNVPVRIEDGGDGSFNPGDHFEFLGEQLRGEHSYYGEYSRWNVYWFHTSPEDGTVLPEPATLPPPRAPKATFEHLEKEELRARFRTDSSSPMPESWYWARLTHIDRQPFRLELDLSGYDVTAQSPVVLRVELRGWSHQILENGSEIADHRVEVLWGEEIVGTAEWNGQAVHILELSLPQGLVRPGTNDLTLRIPRRRPAPDADPLIDVVLLNWIELDYPRRPSAKEQMPLRKPSRIEADRPSSLRDPSRQADYLMITHHRLKDALEPLARYHRERGFAVEVVDVEDVYDEFHHGILHPRAIRDFVSHAYHTWQKPAPRFVLLVGDASWDPHRYEGDDERYADWTYRRDETRHFVKNESTPYAQAPSSGHRNLVPTFYASTYEGYAASDNAFVTVDGEDARPDLAIGRFPVTEPEELTAIVAKTLRYVRKSEMGPWSRNVLWITNETTGSQRFSNHLAGQLESRGFVSHKVYPSAAEADNVHHQATLRRAFDEGQLLVHFLGHGGRYIWRTGPPDYRKNHDLFTLDHLDELAPTPHLPVILSMTCYSAPFDHPTADSIGEKFLRLPERGAVAVLAASWRNSPEPAFSRHLLHELTQPGATVGEAILRAKRKTRIPILVETYNLLGDPALELALPPEMRSFKNKLRWSTASEVDNFGYDVYRAESEDGPFERVNPDPIHGAGTTDETSHYEYVDAAIDPHKDYYYYIESISLAGFREKFTPVYKAKAKHGRDEVVP